MLFYWITTILLLFVLYSSFKLSVKDWKQKNVCPKIMGIPACYIVFVCFTAAFICHGLNTCISSRMYFICIGIPGIIALIGSVTELSGKTICPKTDLGVPMCYYSLGFCVILLLTKFLSF